jgi:hypothetical protein
MRAAEFVTEKWSAKYKRSINCSNPKGFSQKAHCAGRRKNEDLNEFAPSNGSESGRWYTDDQMIDIVGDGWYNELDISGNLSKQMMIDDAQAWLDDQGYRVQVLNVKVNDDDCDWYIEGSFITPGRQIDELTFKGSPCTKDCSGHRAGYEWSQRKGGVDAASWSRSFNNGAALFKNGY